MTAKHAIVVGAGAGGLAASIDLARAGFRVTLLERASTPGGKMHVREVDNRLVDGGPTVLTMRSIFEQLFVDAGARLGDHITLLHSPVIARHAWSHGGVLDLYPDLTQSRQSIEAFAGSENARGFERFYSQSAKIHQTLSNTFMKVPKPSPLALVSRVLRQHHPSSLVAARPAPNLWRALGTFFSDERLRQLFARYATYVGSSPLSTPATLMLIAHVELEGVWLVDGGMHRLATAMAALARNLGADLHFDTHVSEVLVKGNRDPRKSGASRRSPGASRAVALALTSTTTMSSSNPITPANSIRCSTIAVFRKNQPSISARRTEVPIAHSMVRNACSCWSTLQRMATNTHGTTTKSPEPATTRLRC